MSRSEPSFKASITASSAKQTKLDAPKVNLRENSNVKIRRYAYDGTRLNAHNVEADVVFLDDSFKSVDLPDHHYTNYLSNELGFAGSYVDVAVRQLLADTSVINKECKPIFYRGKNKQRFHDVVCSYMPEEAFEKFQDDFRETDLQTKDAQIDSRGLFRVIVLYLLDDKMNPKLLVVELDPYHLMFPVGDERDWQKRYVQYSSKRLDTGNSFHDVYESSFLKMEVWQHQDFETSLQ